MIIVALPASLCLSPSPPLARRSRNAMSSRPPQNSLQPLRPHPPLASSPPKKRVVFAPDDNTGCPPPPPPHGRSVRDPKIPIGPAQPKRASSFPRFPPYEAFGRRPRAQSQRACKAPPSETLQLTGHSRSRRGRFLPFEIVTCSLTIALSPQCRRQKPSPPRSREARASAQSLRAQARLRRARRRGGRLIDKVGRGRAPRAVRSCGSSGLARRRRR